MLPENSERNDRTEEITRFVESQEYADLHCHLLPGIDDGARDIGDTELLLHLQKLQNVSNIAFSPHFYPEQERFKPYLRRREKAIEKVLADPNLKDGFRFKFWSEVHIAPSVAKMDLRKLSLDEKYVLLEFPFQTNPVWGDYILDCCKDAGLTPVLAHVERFPYFTLKELYRLKEKGCILQSNAGFILKHQRDYAEIAELVDVIASDAHNSTWRNPNLKRAYCLLTEKYGEEYVERLIKNSMNIFGE